MTAEISTKAADWIGNELFVTGSDYELSEGWELPEKLRLSSCHRRRGGVYLGRAWYLQVIGPGPTPQRVIDLVHFDTLNNAGLHAAEAFLRAHGYRCVDQECGEWRLATD